MYECVYISDAWSMCIYVACVCVCMNVCEYVSVHVYECVDMWEYVGVCVSKMKVQKGS